MTQVVYGQKGYLGSSMSVRAAEAYEQGEMPISRWTKTAIIHAENYKDAPDNVIERKIWPHDDEGNYYCSVRVYRLSYLAIDDQGTEYEITMEYIKSNEANPEEIGLNYVSIFKTDPDSDEMIRAGRTWE